MKRLRIIAVLAAVLMATGCGSTQPYSQFTSETGFISSEAEVSNYSQIDTQEVSKSIEVEKIEDDPVSVPGLYADVFKPFCNGMDTLTFNKAKQDVQNIDYTVEITNPEGTLTVSSDEGDIITAEFCWDMNGSNTLYQLMYTRGERFFYASSLAHIQEVSYFTNDSNAEKQVNGLAECEKFLFDGSVSSPSDDSYSVSLLYGTLLEKRAIGDNLTIKAKIEPSYSNKATIDQNYYNIEDIIKKQDGTRFSHIDYWAVADMTDGSEQKVISFTLSGDTIQKIADSQIVANQMGTYVDDLFILPSLAD